MFDGYARQIDTLQILNLKSASINSKWENLKNNTFHKSGTVPITPLLTTIWDQGWPYNALCPSDANGSGGHVLIGCVGVAMAQILKYHNYPNQGIGSYGYTWSGYPNSTANFGTTTYNWANMPGSVSTQNNDIATLMYHTAVSCRSMWGPGSTGVSYVNGEDPMTRAFVNYFGCAFAPLKYVSKASYKDSEWDNLLQNELRNNRPIYYSGDGVGSHSWVCDGLDASNLYHFNWGWGGAYNGYFALNAITPTGNDFTNNQEAIIGIQPNDGSTLLTNTTWSGNVTKTTSVAVPDALTLTVNPGTVVSFDPNCQLQVWGRVLSTGTASNYAVFTATNTTSGWLGIKFDNNYMNFEVMADNAPSNFVYSQIQYAKTSGIYSHHSSEIVIDNCKINNNSSGDYGGGLSIHYTAVKIYNSEFYQNSAVQVGGGFAIGGDDSSSSIIVGNSIYQNTSTMGGGFDLSHTGTFSDNVVYNNQAVRGAGGALIGGVGINGISVINNIFSNNSTLQSNGSGGALYLDNCSANIINNLIANNTAISGGALVIANGSSPLILNTTITKNTTESISSIVFSNSTPTFKNSIVYGNSNGNGKDLYFGTVCVPIVDHCDLEGGINSLGGPGFASYSVSNYTNNIDTNPLFVNASAGAGSGYDGMAANWQLSSASLCINAGDVTGISGLLSATDLAGSPRISGSIDMGAYEYQASFPVSVTIEADQNSVCSGTEVIFTAIPTNEGTAPTYQWKKNGAVVGSNATTYSYIPANGDVITCVLSSNLSNTTGNPATSNSITMSVNPVIPTGQITITGPASVKQGQCSVVYTVPTIANATSYIWTLPIGAEGTSTTNTISVNYSNSAIPGNITVKGHNDCGDGSETQLAISVQSIPLDWEIFKNQTSYDFNTLKTSSAQPDQIIKVDSLNTKNNSSLLDHFSSRIRGYLIPPVSGNYSFYFACDNVGQFWLSTDTTSANAQLKSDINAIQTDWTKNISSQTLVAGQKYFFEIMHYDSVYTDLVKLGWKIPGAAGPVVIKTPYMISCGDNVLAVTFSLLDKKITAYPNWTITPRYQLTPWNTSNKSIKWSSNNTSVATVNIEGKITTVGKGSCRIVAIVADNSVLRDSLDLTVSDFYGPFFVKPEAGPGGDGHSWGNAIDLVSLLDILNQGKLSKMTTVFVSEGIYKPTTTIDRNKTFLLSNVRFVGGFDASSTGTDTTSRDIKLYETILSGDIGVQGESIDNSYHVITAYGRVTIDGMTIRDGRASASTNGYIRGYYSFNNDDNGGGVLIPQIYSNILIKDSKITNNSAWDGGGGICCTRSHININQASVLTIQNTSVNDNCIQQTLIKTGGIFNILVNGHGAGISLFTSNLNALNSKIFGNSAPGYGKAIYLEGAKVNMERCSIYKNVGNVEDLYAMSGSAINMKNTTVAGSIASFFGGTINLVNSSIVGGGSVEGGDNHITLDNSFWTNINLSQIPDTAQVNVKYSILGNTLYGSNKYIVVMPIIPDYKTWLDSISNNGGFTPTMKLKNTPNNPAMSKGNPLNIGTADQRGALRTDSVSIGAYHWVKPTKVTINPKQASLCPGDSMAVSVSVLPDLASDNSFTLTSLNSNIAVVRGSKIFAMSPGIVAIVVTTNDGGLTDTCKVEVTGAIETGTILGAATVCQGQNSVIYTVTTIANATSYIWTLPSGATGTSTTNSITVSYGETAISGNVTVKGHNDCGDGPESSMAVTVNSIITQDITMITGWNIISTYAVPVNLDIKAIFQTLIDDGKLKKVMDEAGKTIENFGAFGGWKNNIGNHIPTEGYKVNLTGNATLQLTGTPVELPFNIGLSSGWNIVAYPCTIVQDAQALIQPLINSGVIKKVMDESGKTIEDFGAFGGWKNNIGNFIPGKGYKINVASNCILTISANTTKAAVTISEVLASTHFTKVFEGNGTDHMNVNLIDLQTSGLQAGDEIGIFDGENCVGAVTIGIEQLKSGSISIPASANEGTGILVNGFTTGNTIGLQLYRGNQSFNLQTETLQGTLAFEKNGSVFVKVAASELPIVQINKEPDQFRCYPNPFKDELTVEIWNAEETIVEVGIYNLLGQRIKNLYNGANKGKLTLKWNGSNESGQKVVPGVYLCKVNDQSLKILLKN